MPEDWFEAARIDGAEFWQITWHITLPNLRGVCWWRVYSA